MKNLLHSISYPYRPGAAPILFLFILFILLGILLGIDYGYIFYMDNCVDTPITTCLSDFTNNTNKQSSELADPSKQSGIIVAHGNISSGKYNVKISMNIPEDGGGVTGQFSGTCDGKIIGTSTGDGKVSGKAYGSCSPLLVPIPVQAKFDGVLIPSTRTVPISGSGTAMGVSKSGSVTLTY